MGVTDNRRNVFLSQNSLTRNGDSSEDDGWEIINAESSDESLPPTPPPAPATTVPTRNQVSSKKKPPLPGHRLALKKGRRSVHRYMEEKSLFQSYLADETNDEECAEGWDIGYQESKSYFTFLLDENNDGLLNEFVEDSDNLEKMVKAAQKRDWKNSRVRKNSIDDDSSNEDTDPEEAFLSISQNLRQAFKKHLPLGMLEALENEIVEFFKENPNTEYISSELSSYERLLVHAASSYNRLYSRSYDENGLRILHVENRNKGKEFSPIDPSLTNYLKIRNGK